MMTLLNKKSKSISEPQYGWIMWLLAAIIPTIVICCQMRVWDMDFSVPVSLSGDGMLGIMQFQSIRENGLSGLWFNDRIGAPEISALIDTPFMDYSLTLIVWLVTQVTPSSPCAFFVVYILSYTLAGISGFALFHKIIKNKSVALIFAIIFSLLPYHFYRGMGHLTFSFYYVVAIGMRLALDIYTEDCAGGVPVSAAGNIGRRFRYCAAIVIVGFSNVYFSFYVMMTLLMAIVVKAIKKADWKVMLREGRTFLGMAACFLMGVAPKVLYGWVNGANAVAGIRSPKDTEIYAMKLIQLLLPPGYCRIPFLSAIYNAYTNNAYNVNENALSCLGTAGVIGFMIACAIIVMKLVKSEWVCQRFTSLSVFLSLMVLVFALWCTAGGFGTIFSYLITPELRCNNRASIVIDVLCLLILAELFDRCMREERHRKAGFVGLLILFGICMIVDVQPMNAAGWQEAAKQADRQYEEFFGEIEDTLDEGDMVYQLPAMEFPEVDVGYCHFKGYVYTDTLKWSYGAMKGRNYAAMDLYVDDGMSVAFIDNIAGAGFEGVYIDASMYEDGGAEIIAFYEAVVSQNPIVSEDGELYFFSLNLQEWEDGIYTEACAEYAAKKSAGWLMEQFDISDVTYIDFFTENEDLDYGEIYDSISEEVLPTDLDTYVWILYEKILGRDPGEEELQGWVNRMTNGMTYREAFVSFCNSEEYQNGILNR